MTKQSVLKKLNKTEITKVIIVNNIIYISISVYQVKLLVAIIINQLTRR